LPVTKQYVAEDYIGYCNGTKQSTCIFPSRDREYFECKCVKYTDEAGVEHTDGRYAFPAKFSRRICECKPRQEFQAAMHKTIADAKKKGKAPATRAPHATGDGEFSQARAHMHAEAPKCVTAHLSLFLFLLQAGTRARLLAQLEVAKDASDSDILTHWVNSAPQRCVLPDDRRQEISRAAVDAGLRAMAVRLAARTRPVRSARADRDREDMLTIGQEAARELVRSLYPMPARSSRGQCTSAPLP
jgi:hypothetical protein